MVPFVHICCFRSRFQQQARPFDFVWLPFPKDYPVLDPSLVHYLAPVSDSGSDSEQTSMKPVLAVQPDL
jgi:hypothetical protein